MSSTRPRLGLPQQSPQEAAIASLIAPRPDAEEEEEEVAPTVGFMGSKPTQGAAATAEYPAPQVLPTPPLHFQDIETTPQPVRTASPVVIPPGAPQHPIVEESVAARLARNLGGRPRGPKKERIHYYVLQETSNIIDETFRRGRHPVSGQKFSSPSEVIDTIVALRHASFLVID
jgi:hypothetical protein